MATFQTQSIFKVIEETLRAKFPFELYVTHEIHYDEYRFDDNGFEIHNAAEALRIIAGLIQSSQYQAEHYIKVVMAFDEDGAVVAVGEDF